MVVCWFKLGLSVDIMEAKSGMNVDCVKKMAHLQGHNISSNGAIEPVIVVEFTSTPCWTCIGFAKIDLHGCMLV